MSRARRIGMMVAVLPLVGCDHASKWAAKEALENGPPRQLLGRILELRYAENTDIAFNLLRWVPETWRTRALLIFGAVAVTALLVALWRARENALAGAALALIAAGAIGNYVDRLARGYVVDFIHISHWPVFNVADMYVAAGAALMAWSAWRRSPVAAR
jgi:signal peptidase II